MAALSGVELVVLVREKVNWELSHLMGTAGMLSNEKGL